MIAWIIPNKTYRTKRHRFSPNFLAKFLAVSHDVTSFPNHNINLLNRSRLGRICWGNCTKPLGRHTILAGTLLLSKTKKSFMYGTSMAVSLLRIFLLVITPLQSGFGSVVSFFDKLSIFLKPMVSDNTFSRGKYKLVLLTSILISIFLILESGTSYNYNNTILALIKNGQHFCSRYFNNL